MNKINPAKLDDHHSGKSSLYATPTTMGGPLELEGWFELDDESLRSDVGWKLLVGEMSYEGYVVLTQENHRIAKVNIMVTMPRGKSYKHEDTGPLNIYGSIDQSDIPKK